MLFVKKILFICFIVVAATTVVFSADEIVPVAGQEGVYVDKRDGEIMTGRDADYKRTVDAENLSTK